MEGGETVAQLAAHELVVGRYKGLHQEEVGRDAKLARAHENVGHHRDHFVRAEPQRPTAPPRVDGRSHGRSRAEVCALRHLRSHRTLRTLCARSGRLGALGRFVHGLHKDFELPTRGRHALHAAGHADGRGKG